MYSIFFIDTWPSLKCNVSVENMCEYGIMSVSIKSQESCNFKYSYIIYSEYTGVVKYNISFLSSLKVLGKSVGG